MRLNLPPDETTVLPLVEQPAPKGPRLAEVSLNRRPEIGDLLRRDELQRVVRLGLAQQLADQIRARRRLRIVHDARTLRASSPHPTGSTVGAVGRRDGRAGWGRASTNPTGVPSGIRT